MKGKNVDHRDLTKLDGVSAIGLVPGGVEDYRDIIVEIVKTNKSALREIASSLKSPMPELEEIIASDAYASCLYAKHVLKGPFPKGEDAIATNSHYSYLYARDALNGPFPKGEDVISKEYGASFSYARDVLKGPFPKGEEAIRKNAYFADVYNKVMEELGYTHRINYNI